MTTVRPPSRSGDRHAGPATLVVRLDDAVPSPRAVVHVRGEVDVSNVAPLRTQLIALASRDGTEDGTGVEHVDVDLSGVPFCDVVGLNALIAAHERLDARGGSLVLHDPCWSLRRMLEILDMPELRLHDVDVDNCDVCTTRPPVQDAVDRD